MALLNRLLHEAAKTRFFTDCSRCRRDHDYDPTQGRRRDEREIVTVPKCGHRIRHKAEEQNDRGMNCCYKEDCCNEPPQPLPGGQGNASERVCTGHFRRSWRTTSVSPPEEKREKQRLGDATLLRVNRPFCFSRGAGHSDSEMPSIDPNPVTRCGYNSLVVVPLSPPLRNQTLKTLLPRKPAVFVSKVWRRMMLSVWLK